MESLREGYATPPREPFLYSQRSEPSLESPTSSTSGCISGDDGSEKSQIMPSSLLKQQWQLCVEDHANVSELSEAVVRCKNLVMESESGSEERKWLVRHLIELRLRIRELKDALPEPYKNTQFTKVVLGHHFSVSQQKVTTSVRQYCDHCSGVIWSVVQASYVCSDCGYCCHHKCLPQVLRICAHVIASEHGGPIQNICPEKGLSLQGYKCAECQASLTFKNIWTEPRLCDYSGLYYCPTCHWNSVSVIPARVLHNWDFEPRQVSRASFQLLTLLYNKPVLNLQASNSKLFHFVEELSIAKKHREDLSMMIQYLNSCRKATENKLQQCIAVRRHFIDKNNTLYSMADLDGVRNGDLNNFLVDVKDKFLNHIRDCEICKGKGYLCELCGNDEIIFPFDAAAVPCAKCNSVFHRVCWSRKNHICPKCLRVEQRNNTIINNEEGTETSMDQ